MQAGVVDSPEIQVSYRPPPEDEIRRAGHEKHGGSDNNIGLKGEFQLGSGRTRNVHVEVLPEASLVSFRQSCIPHLYS